MSEQELRRRLDSVTGELLSTYEEIEALTTVAEIASSTADVATVGRRVLDEAVGLTDADVGFMFYTAPELKGEEPTPTGILPEERDALAAALDPWLTEDPKPVVMAPFDRGAAVPHAPDALLAVPLRCQDQVLGAICLGRRGEQATFPASDLKILSVLGSSAAAVLLQRKNFDLVRLTRDLEERNRILNGILAISREIVASLDLDRLLHALANLPTKALGFDRCAVVLEDHGRLRLRAVSGSSRIDRADPEMKSLERLLDWVAGRAVRVLVQRGESADAELSAQPAEAAEQVGPYLDLSDARSFLAIPLRDDQGLLGVISFESGTGDFVDDTRLEGATILANQATVALRNARLYGDVPFIGLLAPLRSGLTRARSLPRGRLMAWIAAAVLVLGILIFGQRDLRVAGTATVLPHRLVQVSAPVRGVIGQIGDYKEGDLVPRGAVLARLDVPELVLRQNEAAARLETAVRKMGLQDAGGDAAKLQMTRVEAERWRIERDHLQSRLRDATLKAPIEGVLLTPRLQERAGELLEVGGVFCTLAEMEPLRVEIAVREQDADLLLGNTDPLMAVLKFRAFPESDRVARVDHVRSVVEEVLGERFIVAEGDVRPAPGDGRLRPGMTGEARIDVGSRSLLWVFLRRPYRFLRRMIWL
ncbi:MAG: GAF domain-containing protein [Acidobacteriota bacterium]